MAVGDNMACIPETDAHCVKHELGPQHECLIKFRCPLDKIDIVMKCLDLYKCDYSLKDVASKSKWVKNNF